MKKVSIFLAVIMLVSLLISGCSVSGEYTARQTQSVGGELEVTLTLKDNVIVGCEIELLNEEASSELAVLDVFEEQTVERNSILVDSVSGATVSREAYIHAASEALKMAGLDPNDYMK